METERKELFTLVVDIRGGTYLHQCTAPNVRMAVSSWARTFEPSTVEGLDEAGFRELTGGVQNDEPTRVEGLDSVWCLSALVGDDLAIVNVIQTAQ